MDVAAKALGAIGTGVGVLGFVTLVGGAIFYAQMSAVGLPSDQIVSAMPQSTLLVVGARFIVPVLVFVWVGIGLVRIAELFWGRHVDRTSASRPTAEPSEGEPPQATDTAHTETSSASASTNLEKNRLDWPRSCGTCLLGLVEAVFVVRNLLKVDSSAIAYLVLLLIGVVLLGVIWFFGIRGRPGPRFAIYAAVTSVAAASFAAAFATTLASVGPAVRAVVIERTDGSAIAGIYAAANSTEVMVGEVCEQSPGSRRGSKRSGFLTIVPRDSVKRMFVTTNGSLKDALTREPALLDAVHVKPRNLRMCTESGLPETLEAKPPLQGVPGVLQGP